MKKQKTKREKLPPTKKLKKQLWELCRQIVLNKYKNKCILCDKTEKINVHHWIFNELNSSKYRYDVNNLTCLCFYHHLRYVHTRSSWNVLKTLKDAILSKGIITEQQLKEIAEDKDYMSVDCDNRIWLNEQIELRKQELQRLNDYKFIEVEMLKGLEKIK